MRYLIYSTEDLSEVSTIIISILQMDNVRLREEKELTKFTMPVNSRMETWAWNIRLQNQSS